MTFGTHTLRIILVSLLALALFGPLPVAAQTREFDPSSYTSELTGVEIEVSGPVFEIIDVELQNYPDGKGEIVQVESTSTPANIEISFFDDSDTPNGSLDVYLNSLETAADEFEVIDRGTSGDYVYALALIEFDGVEIIYYAQVFEDLVDNADLFEAILTSSIDFETDLTAAQDEILVDGFSYMENVSASDIAGAISGEGSLGEEPDSTPAGPEESVVFARSDSTIGLGPDFSFASEVVIDGEIEAVQVEGPTTRTVIAVGETGDTPAQAISSFTNGVTAESPDAVLAYEEIGPEFGWKLMYVPSIEGEATFLLIVVDTTVLPGFEVLHSHELPADTVAGSIVTIRDQVSMNGEPLMGDLDPEEIDFYANRYITTELEPDTPDTIDEATAEPAEDDPEGTTDNPRDGARLPDPGDDEDDEGNTSETGGTVVPTEPGSD